MNPGQAMQGVEVGRAVLLGLPVDTKGLRLPDDLDAAACSGVSLLVTFINPNSCYIASQRSAFVETLQRFDRVCCDGVGMVIAARLKLHARVPRQSFDTTSVAPIVLGWARDRGMPIFLVGGKPGIAAKAAAVLTEHLPGLNFAGAYSGYGAAPAEARSVIVRTPGALVICGMGAPLQEEFLLDLRQAGWKGIGFTCGGYFDQLCEAFHYYPGWIDRWNLRFAYRLWREPGRLAKRYLRDYGVFFRRLFAS